MLRHGGTIAGYRSMVRSAPQRITQPPLLANFARTRVMGSGNRQAPVRGACDMAHPDCPL